MDRPTVGQVFLRATVNARAEIFLAIVIIILSLVSPVMTLQGILLEVLAALTIPLLLVSGSWAIAPLFIVGALLSVDFGEHLLLTGMIVYLAVQYAISAKRIILAAIIALQWLLIAYGISLSVSPRSFELSSVVFEISFLVIAVGVGYLRLRGSVRVKRQKEAQQQIQETLRVGISRYLHDSLARSLTIIIIQADRIEDEVLYPIATKQSARMIANTGRAAIRDLHELMEQLVGEDLSSTSSLSFKMSNTSSIGKTIASSVCLLKSVGFDVDAAELDPGLRIETKVETAFALTFSEVTANIIKHAIQHSEVIISIQQYEEMIKVGVSNERKSKHSQPVAVEGCGMGLGNIRARLSEVGGNASISFASANWQVDMILPMKTTVKEV